MRQAGRSWAQFPMRSLEFLIDLILPALPGAAWQGPLTVCRTALFVTVQEHCIAYCRCREAVKLFRFLLTPYSLTGTCNHVHSCFFRWPAQIWVLINLYVVLGLVAPLVWVILFSRESNKCIELISNIKRVLFRWRIRHFENKTQSTR
jgi:hypothetical protein